MNDPFSTSGPDDAIFGQFMLDFDKAKDKEAVLRSYCERSPGQALRFRKTAETYQFLAGIGPDIEPPPVLYQLGDCRIIRLIARGGMGGIYEAVQAPLNRR